MKPSTTNPTTKFPLQAETLALAARLAKQLHTTLDDIASMAAHAGIEAMAEAFDRDREITIPVSFAMRTRGRCVVTLPAKDVELLAELCEASGITGGLEGLAGEILGNIAKDSLKSDVRKGSHLAHGALDIIPAAGNLGDDHDSAVMRMQDVVDRWNATEATS